MKNKSFKILDALGYLRGKGVPFIIKTEYENGNPVRRSLLGELKLTKTGKFYRVNGKIVSTGWVLEMNRLGMLKHGN